MSGSESPQFRAELDFEVSFASGGRLSGEGFRIDVTGPDLSDEQLGTALIRDLGLLLAGEVRISRRQIFPDRHQRAVPADSGAATGGAADAEAAAVRHADLSHVIRDGMVTIPGFPVPRIQAQSVSARLPPGRYAPGVSFAIGEISMCGNTSTYLDSPRHLLPGGDDPARPAHSVLLAAGIGICEHLSGLAALPGAGFRFTAVPPKVAAFGTFPVRAYATWAGRS
jgi:hypothetical protein